jgi:hypothetical protein
LPNPTQTPDTLLLEIGGRIVRAKAALRLAEAATHDLEWDYCSQTERAAIELIIHDGRCSRLWKALKSELAEAQELLGDISLAVDLALYPDAPPSDVDDALTAGDVQDDLTSDPDESGLNPDCPLETKEAAAAWAAEQHRSNSAAPSTAAIFITDGRN